MPMMKPRSSRGSSGMGSGGIMSATTSSELHARSSKSDAGITMVSHGGSSGVGSAQGSSSGANGIQMGVQRGSSAAQAQAQQQQQQLVSAAQARKRRSSINVYDQPSSLNSRLRQLETDMLRLDEDRTKLFDDTHSALTQYEIKLGEIHAILKSRQDNVEKYVEDMKMLLQAKEEFEKQTKLLNDKHDRIHEKFTHRETIISREIKLLKNKFELLEKNRQFRSLLHKSGSTTSSELNQAAREDSDLASGLDYSGADSIGAGGQRKRSEIGGVTSGDESLDQQFGGAGGSSRGPTSGRLGGANKNVRIKLSKFGKLSQILSPIFRISAKQSAQGSATRRRKTNKVSSIMVSATGGEPQSPSGGGIVANVAHDAVGCAPNELDADAGGARDQPTTTTTTANNNKKGAKSGSLMSRLFSSGKSRLG